MTEKGIISRSDTLCIAKVCVIDHTYERLYIN